MHLVASAASEELLTACLWQRDARPGWSCTGCQTDPMETSPMAAWIYLLEFLTGAASTMSPAW